MARKQQVHSSKKLKKSVSKQKRKAAPKSDSESVASEADALPVLENPHGSDAQDAHGSDGSLNVEQPLRSPLSQQDFHRSSECNSPSSSLERPDHSQERTSPHRSQERTSPHLSVPLVSHPDLQGEATVLQKQRINQTKTCNSSLTGPELDPKILILLTWLQRQIPPVHWKRSLLPLSRPSLQFPFQALQDFKSMKPRFLVLATK
jgi:hypothetical protein